MAIQYETSELLDDEDRTRYLLFGSDEYLKEFNYAPADSPDIRIDDIVKNEERRQARKKMVENMIEFDKTLTDLEKSGDAYTDSFDQVLRSLAHQIAYDASFFIKNEEERTKTQTMLRDIDLPPWLFSHMDESGRSVEALFRSAKKAGNEEILDPRKQILLKFVGLTHDVGKLMGTMGAQIDPDHEIFYRIIIGRHLEGKKFGGIVFNANDVEFVTSVAGFHEDIFREKDFANQATALVKTDEVTLDIEIARARALFHFIDIFGDAVRIDEGRLRIVNKKAFKQRFLDLYQRHIKLPIVDATGTDWTAGKVTRPEWGEHGVAGLTWTFDILGVDWGIQLDPDLIPSVRSGIEGVLDQAEAAILGIQNNNPDYKLKIKEDENKQEIEKFLKDTRERIKKTREEIRKEYE